MESDHLAVKSILRYLVHTPLLGLWYPKEAKFDLLGYTDADWLEKRWIRSQPPVHANFFGAHWCAGTPKSRIVSPSPPPKRSMSLPQVLLRKSYGWGKLWRIMDSSIRRYPSYVTMKVLSRLPTTLVNILAPSILTFVITSYGSYSKGWYCSCTCGHRQATCRYLHQAIGWSKVLPTKRWTWYLGAL